MNKHIHIAGALNRSSPRQLAGADAPQTGTLPIGAAQPSAPPRAERAEQSTGGATAPNAPTEPCSECNGAGEVCLATYHPDDPRADRWAVCHECDGTGLVDITCECGSPLDARGYCAECECFDGEPQCIQCGAPLEDAPCADCESNVGWLRAETSAFGMGAK